MSEQNRTAPRWQDVPEEWRGAVRQAMSLIRDEAPPANKVRPAIDAALARLAEPAQSSAAERWLAVPERARAAKLSELSDDVTIYSASPDCDTDGIPYADHAEASRALLALAREAERSGA